MSPRKSPLERTVFKRKGKQPLLARSPFQTTKPRKGSKRELEKHLESLNAKYVKMRDGYQCVQCAEDGIPNQGILDAGHLYPKSVFRATKFRVEAIYCQCRFHNMQAIGRPEYLLLWFEKKFGSDKLSEIHDLAVSDWRPTREWLVEQIAEREKQISELGAHLCAMV